MNMHKRPSQALAKSAPWETSRKCESSLVCVSVELAQAVTRSVRILPGWRAWVQSRKGLAAVPYENDSSAPLPSASAQLAVINSAGLTRTCTNSLCTACRMTSFPSEQSQAQSSFQDGPHHNGNDMTEGAESGG